MATTTISELKEMMKDHLRGQQEDRMRFKEMEQMLILMFQETDAKFKETEKRFQETDARFKETDKLLSLKFQETDAKFQETDKQFKETGKRIKEAVDLFTSQWGKLVESLVEGDLIRVLNERNIAVTRTLRRVAGRKGDTHFEFDIVAIDGDEVVIVEVKTTLRPKDIKKFIEKLENAKVWMPEYAPDKIYGAVAFLQSEAEAARMAERQGLFVINATGDSAIITNSDTFKPKVF